MRYYVEPKDWYVNRWHNTKEHTKELKKSGKIANIDGEMSSDEKIYTPPLQELVFQKIHKDIEKELIFEKSKLNRKDRH